MYIKFRLWLSFFSHLWKLRYLSLPIILRCETISSSFIASSNQVHFELTLQRYFRESFLNYLLSLRGIRGKTLSAVTTCSEGRLWGIQYAPRGLDRWTPDQMWHCRGVPQEIRGVKLRISLAELASWSLISRKLGSRTILEGGNKTVIIFEMKWWQVR